METISQKFCYLVFGTGFPLILIYFFLGVILFNSINKLLKNKWVRIIFVSLPFIFYFLKILKNDPFFFSDDFSHLYLVSNFSFRDIFNMAMLPQGIWVGHRIVFGFWLFKLLFDLFKTNPIPYYWAMFFINLGNGILFYLLVSKILVNRKITALIAFIFGFFYVTWLSNIHEVLGLMFLLSMLICCASWLRKFKIKTFLFSVILYLLAIFTKEISFLVVPVIFLFALTTKNKSKENLKYFYILYYFSTLLLQQGGLHL